MCEGSWREYTLSRPRRHGVPLRRQEDRIVIRPRTLVLGSVLLALVVALGAGQAALEAAQGQGVEAPVFEVDPFWPKPLPNHWILGSAIGVGVDSRDHVFIVHRGFPTLAARTEAGLDTKPPNGDRWPAAPPTLATDTDG